jgi:O-antigen biosynthesis protein
VGETRTRVKALRSRVRKRLSVPRRRAGRHPAAAVAEGTWREFLFVSGPGGSANRYRCVHQAEALAFAGRSVDLAYRDTIDQLARAAKHYDCIVLYRVPWDAGVGALIEAASEEGCRIISDVDDLVFDPDRLGLIDARSGMIPDERRLFDDSVAGLRLTLERSDGVVVSTDSLVNHAASVNGNLAISYNLVSDVMVEAAERVCTSARPSVETVTFAYLSGTPTHQADFQEVDDALMWMLEQYPRSRVMIVGFLDIDSKLARYGERVWTIGYRSWRELPALLAEHVDVNLAPLQSNNEFVDSKSCLKYLEAALVSVPTIASPSTDFLRVISHGANGMLASGEEQWHAALAALMDPEVRHSLGQAARRNVLEHHTTRVGGARVVTAFNSLLVAD